MYSREQIVLVTTDEKVKEIFDAVSGVACTGGKGDGKIFVSDISDAMDLCTKKQVKK